jgi:hypothetical protein
MREHHAIVLGAERLLDPLVSRIVPAVPAWAAGLTALAAAPGPLLDALERTRPDPLAKLDQDAGLRFERLVGFFGALEA